MSADTYNINVMVDLETLGTAPRSTILSIGAVEFNVTGVKPREFYQEINAQQPGRTIQISTLQWWMKQSIKPPLCGDMSVEEAVRKFNYWCLAKKEQAKLVNRNDSILKDCEPQIILWANGIDFDWGLLKEVMEDYSIPSAVKYNAVRDYRTLATLHSIISRPEMPPDLAHNALEDARAQALHCIELLKHVGYW